MTTAPTPHLGGTHDLTDLLAPTRDVDPADLDRLHAALEAAAASGGDLDVAYRTLDTPIGLLLLAATEQGLVRIAFERENHDAVLDRLAALVSPRILHAPRRLDAAARELDEYFAGARHAFDLELDHRLSTGFRLSVLAHLPHIAYGRTESYAQVALAAGSPRAMRAVGTACATNPLPLVVPCHRVVRSDGSYGGYLGGTEAKHLLLSLEAAGVARVRAAPNAVLEVADAASAASDPASAASAAASAAAAAAASGTSDFADAVRPEPR
ncbi:methylated-DNA-[protein]-cysteine S-methyltransferase [Leifsonia psychrotolerans]|uniref:Methylated-DNA--protein-cysteine methyltransferase n=1 Tax=Glaciibacter psychrotolerans TaxID=670054 RepID=A0A7Z0EGA4_9MICO|nr:methylated-DNA-[protein]-cysteine S-methyltransferase [Leifsonia psychrotolerans]